MRGLTAVGYRTDEGQRDATVAQGAIGEEALRVGQSVAEVLLDLLIGPSSLESEGCAVSDDQGKTMHLSCP